MATLQKLEPLVRLAELVLRDPRKIIQSSVAEVATALYYLACETQKSTAGRSLSAREKVSLLSSAIQETEWLAELLWRHNYGNRSAWRNTLRLQIVKSMLDLSVRYELFLLPWVWVTLKGKLIGVEGDAERGPDAVVQIPAADGDSSLSNALADKVPGAHPSPPAPGAVAVLPSSLPTRTKGKYGIVIPRVASQSCSSRAFHMHINWLDVLGMIVDLYQTVRPVVAVGLVAATSVHATPCPQVSQLLRGGVDTQAASTESMLRCISNLTASDSLLSDWRTWMIICCLDIATLLIAQFVKRRRVPVVMINAGDPDGTKPIAERDADGPPQSPVVPQGEAADGGLKITTVTVGQVPHRDQLRVKQALRLLGSSFLRDPFFTVMVKPIIMKLVSSRLVSRIPLFGSIFAHHAAYSMLLQHLSFLYTIGH